MREVRKGNETGMARALKVQVSAWVRSTRGRKGRTNLTRYLKIRDK